MTSNTENEIVDRILNGTGMAKARQEKTTATAGAHTIKSIQRMIIREEKRIDHLMHNNNYKNNITIGHDERSPAYISKFFSTKSPDNIATIDNDNKLSCNKSILLETRNDLLKKEAKAAKKREKNKKRKRNAGSYNHEEMEECEEKNN